MVFQIIPSASLVGLRGSRRTRHVWASALFVACLRAWVVASPKHTRFPGITLLPFFLLGLSKTEYSEQGCPLLLQSKTFLCRGELKEGGCGRAPTVATDIECERNIVQPYQELHARVLLSALLRRPEKLFALEQANSKVSSISSVTQLVVLRLVVFRQLWPQCRPRSPMWSPVWGLGF